MQQQLIAGDTLNFPVSVPDYPATAGWVLKYRLVPRTVGGTAISLTATAEGSGYRVQALAATTAGWGVDSYTWTSWVELGAESYTLESGQITVLPNPRTAAAGTDGRSLARRTLDDLMAAKAGWDTTGGRVRRYKIGEREQEFNSEADILQKIFFWEGQVAKEEQAANLAKGIKPKNRILTRFVRPS